MRVRETHPASGTHGESGGKLAQATQAGEQVADSQRPAVWMERHPLEAGLRQQQLAGAIVQVDGVHLHEERVATAQDPRQQGVEVVGGKGEQPPRPQQLVDSLQDAHRILEVLDHVPERDDVEAAVGLVSLDGTVEDVDVESRLRVLRGPAAELDSGDLETALPGQLEKEAGVATHVEKIPPGCEWLDPIQLPRVGKATCVPLLEILGIPIARVLFEVIDRLGCRVVEDEGAARTTVDVAMQPEAEAGAVVVIVAPAVVGEIARIQDGHIPTPAEGTAPHRINVYGVIPVNHRSAFIRPD